jgi:excisionase family DNA binding protein
MEVCIMRKFLTSRDAAARLGVSQMTISDWARKGVLPVAGEAATGVRLFDPAAVDRLAEKREQACSKESDR